MIKVIKESVDTDLLQGIDEVRDLLSLGANIGFRQISGIDVMTNLDTAMRNIEKGKASQNEDETKFYIHQAELYLKECNKSLNTLMSQVDSLSSGCDKIIPILSSVTREINSLK